MIRTLASLVLSAALTLPASADDFAPVTDETAFLALVQGRELRIGLYNLTLSLLPDGRVTGSALGWGITGSWAWQDGFFCRELDWSGTAIPYNCQLVEARGTDAVRFTVDRGAGDSASFKLR